MCEVSSKTLNDHFLKYNRCLLVNQEVMYGHRETFQFGAFTEDDENLAVHSIKSDSVGHDSIGIRFIKLVFLSFIAALTHVLNHITTMCSFAECRERAVVTPIEKKASSIFLEDFRPITVLPTLSKVFERLTSGQIGLHLNIKNIQNSSAQSSNEHSSEVRLGGLTVLVTIDFSKAFDTVGHNLLLLEFYYGFSSSAINLIKSHLENVYQRVEIGGASSKLELITSGVPQTAILGPLLFSVFSSFS